MTAKTSHILVVDDDTRIRDLLKSYLIQHGYIVSSAKDTQEARAVLEYLVVDLIILDIMMPQENGIEFAQMLRKNENSVAILMLTAMDDVEQRITGLVSGADDYMAKPFEPRELLIRIEKLIRHKMQLENAQNFAFFGDIKYDLHLNILSNNKGTIQLGSGESQLLKLLISYHKIPVSREKLAEACGNINVRSVDVQINRLREKIEVDPKKPRFIQTVRGKGYALFASMVGYNL